jgi:DNA-directed RNA polymerase subunit H (RpoH/RPB5)
MTDVKREKSAHAETPDENSLENLTLATVDRKSDEEIPREVRDSGDRSITAIEFAGYVIIRNIWSSFLTFRSLEPVLREARTGASDRAAAKLEEPSKDTIVTEMENRGYLRIDARRKQPRGALDHVVILALSGWGKYSHFSPDLRALLGGLDSEPSTRGRLDEVILVVETEFFRKKNLIEVVRKFQEREAGGADLDGAGPVYSVFPYHVFSNVVPTHVSVPRHSIISDDEVKAYLSRERLGPKDVYSIYSNDPPVIWIGGRPGQFVQVERDSETAGVSIVVRYITRAPLA